MNVGSVGNAAVSASTQAIPRQPETAEVRMVGGDRDQDKDDRGSTVEPAPPPVTNANGQLIGQIINTTA